MGKAGTDREEGLAGMWIVPENLEAAPWGFDFQGLFPPSSHTVSAMDRGVQAFLGPSIHRSPSPISNQLPSTGDSLVCELSPKCPAAKPSVSRYHLGRALSEQLDSSWFTFDVWFDFQLETNWS